MEVEEVWIKLFVEQLDLCPFSHPYLANCCGKRHWLSDFWFCKVTKHVQHRPMLFKCLKHTGDCLKTHSPPKKAWKSLKALLKAKGENHDYDNCHSNHNPCLPPINPKTYHNAVTGPCGEVDVVPVRRYPLVSVCDVVSNVLTDTLHPLAGTVRAWITNTQHAVYTKYV